MTFEAPSWTPDGAATALISYPDKHDQAFLPSWDARVANPDRLSSIAEAVADVEGLLYDEDAMKLYELASFTPGPILEIGVFRGRSTTVMAEALADSGNPARIVSIDIDPQGLAAAAENIGRHGVAERVTFVEGTASSFLSIAPTLRPGLVFVDGDHTFTGALRDLRAIEPVTPVGSLVVMHDYEGYKEDDPYWIQVEPAVRESWLASQGAFIGRFGLSGVFVRTSGGPQPCDPAQPSPLAIEVEHAADLLVKVRRRLARGVDYRLQALRGRAKR